VTQQQAPATGLRPSEPRTADVGTTDGPQRAVVLGTVGDRTLVRWEAGPRAGRLGWVPPEAVSPDARIDLSDPRLRCTARPGTGRS